MVRTLFLYLHLCMYFFRKNDINRPTTTNVKIMYFINALAIVLFVGGIVYKLVQWYVLK